MAVTAKEKQQNEHGRGSGHESEKTTVPRAEGDDAEVRPDADSRRRRTGREAQYDLLTAALIGAAVGVSATLLLGGARRRGHGMRIVTPGMRDAAKRARRAGAKGAQWAREQGEALWDRVPHDEIGERIRDYADTARKTIDHAVETELREFRKQLRRQRRRHHI
jgi:gas vesicle protein